jgi:5-methylcytosine-specific restriction endonuclease McrA
MSEYKAYKCEHCEQAFLGRVRDRVKGMARFCSRSCAHEGNLNRSKKIENHCRNCGRDFFSSSELTKFCSSSCKKVYNSRIRKVDRRRGIFKKIAMLPCELCGYKRSSRDVHHIEPISEGGSNAEDNLISLCPNCHRECHEMNFSREQLKQIVKQRNITL